MTARPAFIYSPLMDPAAFARAAEQSDAAVSAQLRALPAGRVAEARGMDLVFNAPSAVWGGRIASLIKRPGQSVFGLLVSLEGAQRALWQKLEGEQVEELALEVRVGGDAVEAVALAVPEPKGVLHGPVSERYAHALGASAERAGLPKQYSDRLKAEAMIVERVQAAGRSRGLQ